MQQPEFTSSTLVTLKIRDEQEVARVLEELLRLQALTRAEAGCLRFDLYRLAADPRRLLLIEEFVDEAAFSRHLQAPYTQHYFSLNMTDVLNPIPLAELRADVAG